MSQDVSRSANIPIYVHLNMSGIRAGRGWSKMRPMSIRPWQHIPGMKTLPTKPFRQGPGNRAREIIEASDRQKLYVCKAQASAK